jgi:hypothetical protein
VTIKQDIDQQKCRNSDKNSAFDAGKEWWNDKKLCLFEDFKGVELGPAAQETLVSKWPSSCTTGKSFSNHKNLNPIF